MNTINFENRKQWYVLHQGFVTILTARRKHHHVSSIFVKYYNIHSQISCFQIHVTNSHQEPHNHVKLPYTEKNNFIYFNTRTYVMYLVSDGNLLAYSIRTNRNEVSNIKSYFLSYDGYYHNGCKK